MPNWVSNHLTIRGPQDTLDRVADRLAVDGDKDPLSFQKLLPRPKELDEQWYEWNTANWGTKWDASEATRDRRPGELEYLFSTAWSPPAGFIEKFLAEYPDLTWTYRYEEDQGWGGVLEASGGEFTAVEEYDIPESHADLVARGVTCHCEDFDEPHFEDCFGFRAAMIPGISPETVEAATVLGRDWQGTFDQLIEAAARL